MKPKIILVVDSPEWAFDFSAKNICKRLSSRYDMKIVYIKKRPGRGKIHIRDIQHEPFDLLFSFASYGPEVQSAIALASKNKLTASVRSFRSVFDHPDQYTKEFWSRHYAAVGLVCQSLKSVVPMDACAVFDTPHAVDTDLFKPKEHHHDFTIGFAGNRRHGCLKGVDLLLEAADRCKVRCLIGDKHSNKIPHDKMPDFYNSIDVYVCMSKTEGGPLSLPEAAACGNAIISTPVGIVPEFITDGVNGFVIDRNVEALVEAIEKLKNDKALTKQMGIENRKRAVEQRSWDRLVENYAKMFDFALEAQ